jgi:hypothetical protein
MTGPAASSRGFLRSASATPSEIDAIRRAMQPAEKAAATERQRDAGGDRKSEEYRAQKSLPETFRNRSEGEARDKIGSFAGVSGRTVEKIAKVVEAAEREPAPRAATIQSGFSIARARFSRPVAKSSRRRFSSSLLAKSAQARYQPARDIRSAASLAGSIDGVCGIANDAQSRSQDSLIQITFRGWGAHPWRRRGAVDGRLSTSDRAPQPQPLSPGRRTRAPARVAPGLLDRRLAGHRRGGEPWRLWRDSARRG